MTTEAETSDPPSSKRPALVTFEKVMELHGRLDLIAQDVKGLSRALTTVADLERRVLTQELSVPPGAFLDLVKKVHEMELTGARRDAAQTTSGNTWEKALGWINTVAILALMALTYFHPHSP